MNTRPGFTLVEALVSCLMLAALTTLCLQLVGVSAAQRRTASLREIALQEAANAMERAAAVRWDELTPEAMKSTSLSPEAGNALPGGILAVDVQHLAEIPEAKRITVDVRWEPSRGKPVEHVRLVAWKYLVRTQEETGR